MMYSLCKLSTDNLFHIRYSRDKLALGYWIQAGTTHLAMSSMQPASTMTYAAECNWPSYQTDSPQALLWAVQAIGPYSGQVAGVSVCTHMHTDVACW